MKCDFGYINYRDGASGSGYLLVSSQSLSKVIEHKFIYYENTYAAIFSLLFVANRTFTHCPTRWKIFMDFLLAFCHERC